MARTKKSRVRVIWPTFAVYCTRCDWNGKRTELNMLLPCPSCKERYCIRRVTKEEQS